MTKPTPTPFVYLAHPIDFVSSEARSPVDMDVNLAIQEAGLAAYIPGFAFQLPYGATPTPVISSVNRHALTQCEGLVAFLPPPGQTSIGVPMEIGQAIAEGKPVCLVAEPGVFEKSWALRSDSDLVFETVRFDLSAARRLRGMIEAQRRWLYRPAPSQAMYVKAEEGAKLPTRAYAGDAGFDLYTFGDWIIQGGENLDVPCGLSVQLPDNVWAMITGRSSTVRKLRLLVTTGIIDSGYRGPLYANVENLGELPIEIKDGQRLAQLIPFPLTSAALHPVQVNVLADSDRGASGFGSSGA